MSDKCKLFIGICNTQESVPSDLFWSFIHIKRPYPIVAYRSTHPWDVVRNNRIIDKFLKSDCNVLAKMDIDQTYPPDYFERLVPLALKTGVSGPLIYDRWSQNNFMPLAFEDVEGQYPIPMDISNLNGVVDIPYPHTNLFYRRDVLSDIPAPWYEAHLSDDGLDRANHVDFSFIKKIHEVGFRVMIDLDCVVRHQFNTFVGKEFHDAWNR